MTTPIRYELHVGLEGDPIASESTLYELAKVCAAIRPNKLFIKIILVSTDDGLEDEEMMIPEHFALTMLQGEMNWM